MANVSQNLPANQGTGAVDKKEAKRLKKEAKAAQKAERGGMKPWKAGLIVFLFMLFLLSAAATMVYFDVLDSRQIMVNLLLEGKSPYDPQIARLEELSLQLQGQNAELEAQRAELEAEQKRLEKLEKTLTAKESQLASQETQLQESTALATASDENMAQLILIYEKMDASQAAKIMEEVYDVEDVAILLSRMKQDKASGILAAMSAAKAARVTELLIE